MSRKTICLNMIVKNESKIIRETLVNICKYIKLDYWVISDTGSSDNTIDIIKSFFKEKEIPGEMHVNTWKDFGHNRSIALELAYNKTDYVFIFDADDKILGNFKLPVLKSDQYFLTFGENDIKYDRSILVNNRKKWIFKGVLHEFIHSDEQINEKTTIEGDYYILSGRTSNRNQDANKYKRDAEILEKAFNDKNTEAGLLPRYSFYLAQSYKDNSDVSNAIKWYTKTLDLNGWVQEKYYSCVMLGDLHLQQGNDKDALKFWLKSIEYDSERIDGIVKACEWAYTNSNHCLVNALYHRFRKYNKNPQGKLFIFYHLYNYRLEYYNSISSFYVNDKQSGYESCKNIMLYKGYKWEHTFSNFMYYFDYFKKDKDELLVNKIKEYLLNRAISFSKRKDLWGKIKDYLKKHKKVWREIDREMGKNHIIKKNEYSSSNKILIYTGLMYFPWNDSYMETHPLGGAEKAVVYLSRNLPKNYDIYISGTVKDEIKDNITYIHHDKLQDLLDKEVFHTIIVSRYVYFFVKYFNIKCYQLLLSAHDSTGFINNMYRSITIDDILRDNNEHIDKVVSLTSWHSNNIISRHPYLSNKINIINNGIDISKFPKNKEKVKNKFIWSSCSERGLHILLNLWEDILQKLPDATLDICSYNTFPKTDADRKMLEIINKHSSIIHHGKLDTTQLYDLMNISEYWLYTNTFPETSCITGMEMLMSNVICIYYPLAGLVDTVGKYGIQVEKGDEIETILSLTEKQKVEIIEKGKQYALKCSWRNRAKEWSKMLNLDNNFIKIINLTRRTDRKNKMKQKLESNKRKME